MWESARANMATYRMLAVKAEQYRADPQVQAAWETAGLLSLSEPTLSAGESVTEFLDATDDFDVQTAAERDYGLVRLHQLALQHLIG